MAANRLRLFEQIAESDPNDVQQPGMVDLARTIRAYVVQYVQPIVTASHRHARAVQERNQLRWLLRRHGIPDDFQLPGRGDCQ